MEELKLRIKWSRFDYYAPIRIIISDWKNLTIVNYGTGKYMLVDCIMEHGKHQIELCIPYFKFVKALRQLKNEEQKLIIQNKAIIELMKTYRFDRGGIKINKVELLQ